MGEPYNEGIVIFGVPVAQLPVPQVPSIPYPCDMCGASIWLSQMTIDKVTEVMPNSPEAQIIYLCHHHNEDLPDAEIEYGCPACPGDVTFPTRDEVIEHFKANHL